MPDTPTTPLKSRKEWRGRIGPEPGARVNLFDLGGMLMELRDLIGRDVDLRTPADVSKYFRDQVVAESKPLYAA